MSERTRRAGSYGRAPGDPLLDELASQAGELAKRWAIALLEDAPPEDIADVDLALIAGEGPGLVEHVLAGAARPRGHSSDRAEAGPGLGALGAGSPGELARALEALRGVLWEAAVEASPRARSDTRVALRLLETSDAIAAVCNQLLAGELDAPAASDAAAAQAGGETPIPGARRAASAVAGDRVVIIDDRPAARADTEAVRPEPSVSAAVGETPAFEPAISARDARPQQGPAAWIDSIGAQLAASEADRRAFAVLLVELVEPFAPPGSGRRRPTLEIVLDEGLRDRGGVSLTQERAGRYWLVSPGSDRVRAERLRERLHDTLSSGRGVAAVAIGIAVFPEDAADAAGLAAQADLDLYTSRSPGAAYYGPRGGRP